MSTEDTFVKLIPLMLSCKKIQFQREGEEVRSGEVVYLSAGGEVLIRPDEMGEYSDLEEVHINELLNL